VLGDSTSPKTAEIVRGMIENRRALVVLDSNHATDHVAKELELYAPLVSPGSYMIAMDGVIKDLVGVWQMPVDAATNNPEIAIARFLPVHPEFERDLSKNRFGITWAPGGFLKKKA
jgi:cephalosporin hydroxylase